VNKDFYSPLRYPGGKFRLATYISQICVKNEINELYIEPYAGGSSVALFLLFSSVIKKIILNDIDRSIYALWYSILNYPDEMCFLIENNEISIQNWKIQREIQKKKETSNLLNLGFSTLFLNRTNISGIISGGVIGGLQQNGKYKLDCRFNKVELIRKIQRIAAEKENIKVYNMNAIDLIKKIEKGKKGSAIYYFDPPYYKKGSTLYLNHYKKNDHEFIREKISNIKNNQWIVSYDDVTEIRKLYSKFRNRRYVMNHTAYQTKIGKEVLFFSDNLVIPKIKGKL